MERSPDAPAAVAVTGLDHIVLRVADVERALAWYTGVLGLPGVRVEEWRAGTAPFPSARVSAETIIDFVPAGDGAPDAGGRLDHLCLVVEPMDLAAVAAHPQIDALSEPATLFGARGQGTSIYVRDPDGTVVELRHYG